MADGCLQLINEDQEIQASALKSSAENWRLEDWDTDYNIVTLCGEPGSGKSTLGNALFDAQFSVSQDGKSTSSSEGVWMSKVSGMNVLAMDAAMMAASDSGKGWTCRLRNHVFVTAVSSVFIVNVNESTFKKDSYSNVVFLLKHIFSAHLALFGRRHKTLLLFAIRDYTEQTTQTKLRSILATYIKSAWDRVKKTVKGKKRSANDFFDYSIVALPSKLDAPDEFDAAVAQLRTR
ncbi:RHD3/Sey1 [Thamnocephalis sphaerospora]|uniref:RHD3/Sey1 n=1 Tax=Thamnocephalis sphaerospora TaxID=78915 RepID=A0A4P9XQL2_9FUNG|nr:RHD3/Sey1 [Thamnocephalis sphaerospora]|eukprot:RKP07781.1 RHD3/Sey1 [Thamnocephalis sphaerospora]